MPRTLPHQIFNLFPDESCGEGKIPMSENGKLEKEESESGGYRENTPGEKLFLEDDHVMSRL